MEIEIFKTHCTYPFRQRMKLIFPAQLVTHTKFRPRLHEAPGIHAFGGQKWWRDGDGGFLTQYNAKGIMRLLSDAFQNDICFK